ncbi:hypothetical protein BKA61DRAFT_204110 [Leptodontidium sp. MPI-SDFR-AT-0119]|nr:hypothetical protein BKA61DRAFT_204110 [Leptodontidium sp. MPI-SDFR-AT-0119]
MTRLLFRPRALFAMSTLTSIIGISTPSRNSVQLPHKRYPTSIIGSLQYRSTPLAVTEFEVGYKGEWWKTSYRDVRESEHNSAPNASEASNQLRRPPNSKNEVFGPF